MAEHMLNLLVAQMPPSGQSRTCSSDAYDRLLAGETVSWRQILRQHRMLGTITVLQLIEVGAVRMVPMVDAQTRVSDVRLSLRDRDDTR